MLKWKVLKLFVYIVTRLYFFILQNSSSFDIYLLFLLWGSCVFRAFQGLRKQMLGASGFLESAPWRPPKEREKRAACEAELSPELSAVTASSP